MSETVNAAIVEETVVFNAPCKRQWRSSQLQTADVKSLRQQVTMATEQQMPGRILNICPRERHAPGLFAVERCCPHGVVGARRLRIRPLYVKKVLTVGKKHRPQVTQGIRGKRNSRDRLGNTSIFGHLSEGISKDREHDHAAG